METVGELVEKLVIANIKLWMVKDAQTYISIHGNKKLKELLKTNANLLKAEKTAEIYDANSLQQLIVEIEKMLKNQKKKNGNLQLLKELVKKDIELCEARAAYRRAINQAVGDTTPSDTVKKYG